MVIVGLIVEKVNSKIKCFYFNKFNREADFNQKPGHLLLLSKQHRVKWVYWKSLDKQRRMSFIKLKLK